MENKQPRKYNRSIEAQDVGKRIDAWIAGEFPEFSRTYIQRLIKGGQIRVNSQFIRPNYRLTKMDFLEIENPF